MATTKCTEFRPDHNGECLNCDETWDAHEHDVVRVARHDTLLQLWRGLDLDELLTDMNILLQLLAFRAHRQTMIHVARQQHAQGATHDCGEWLEGTAHCQVCYRQIT